ncbi:hypothetical protein DFP78_113158 [Photobacterium lutimaris]|nr:hypothetical protein DFP78_113158 [Photobacterium lutimaris]
MIYPPKKQPRRPLVRDIPTEQFDSFSRRTTNRESASLNRQAFHLWDTIRSALMYLNQMPTHTNILNGLKDLELLYVSMAHKHLEHHAPALLSAASKLSKSLSEAMAHRRSGAHQGIKANKFNIPADLKGCSLDTIALSHTIDELHDKIPKVNCEVLSSIRTLMGQTKEHLGELIAIADKEFNQSLDSTVGSRSIQLDLDKTGARKIVFNTCGISPAIVQYSQLDTEEETNRFKKSVQSEVLRYIRAHELATPKGIRAHICRLHFFNQSQWETVKQLKTIYWLPTYKVEDLVSTYFNSTSKIRLKHWAKCFKYRVRCRNFRIDMTGQQPLIQLTPLLPPELRPQTPISQKNKLVSHIARFDECLNASSH